MWLAPSRCKVSAVAEDRIEVAPLKNGNWSVSGVQGSFEDRAQAIEAARVEAGVESLYNADGEAVANTDAKRSVVLMRPDGSVYGELYAPPAGQGAQEVAIEPASESTEAVS